MTWVQKTQAPFILCMFNKPLNSEIMNLMKLQLVGFCFLLLTTLTSFGQKKSKDVSEVFAQLDTQISAWNRGDIDGFMEAYWPSEELVFVGSNGLVNGYNEILANYKRNYPNQQLMGKLAFEIIYIKQWDAQTIQLIGKFSLKREADMPSGHFTLLFRKIEQKWLIVSDHSS